MEFLLIIEEFFVFYKGLHLGIPGESYRYTYYILFDFMLFII